MPEDLRPYGDPGSAAFRVEAYPFFQLNRAASRYNMVIEAELRAIGIDIPTWRVLMILGEAQPLPIGQVSKMAVINISTMMRIVERMVKARLIETQASEQDARVTEVLLTDLGREKLAAARGVTSPVYKRLIKGLSASEFSRLLGLLGKLYGNLE
ncbi:MAG: MarR family transcriptional regulator [Sphingopyxis sp.]|nr:MarR family transcriptional regulator [Sphingopyxis sp.]